MSTIGNDATLNCVRQLLELFECRGSHVHGPQSEVRVISDEHKGQCANTCKYTLNGWRGNSGHWSFHNTQPRHFVHILGGIEVSNYSAESCPTRLTDFMPRWCKSCLRSSTIVRISYPVSGLSLRP